MGSAMPSPNGWGPALIVLWDPARKPIPFDIQRPNLESNLSREEARFTADYGPKT